MALIPSGRRARYIVIAVAAVAVVGLVLSFAMGPAPRRTARWAFGLQALSASYKAAGAVAGPQVDVLLLAGSPDEHDVLRVIDALAEESGESTVTVAFRSFGGRVSYQWSRASKTVVKLQDGEPTEFAAPLTVADFPMIESSDWRPDFRPWSEYPAYQAEAAAKAEEAERKRLEESEYEGDAGAPSQPSTAIPAPIGP